MFSCFLKIPKPFMSVFLIARTSYNLVVIMALWIWWHFFPHSAFSINYIFLLLSLWAFCIALFCLPHHPLHADTDEQRKRKSLENESLCNSRCVVNCRSLSFLVFLGLLTRICKLKIHKTKINSYLEKKEQKKFYFMSTLELAAWSTSCLFVLLLFVLNLYMNGWERRQVIVLVPVMLIIL